MYCIIVVAVLQQHSACLTGLELLCNEHVVTDQPVIGQVWKRAVQLRASGQKGHLNEIRIFQENGG